LMLYCKQTVLCQARVLASGWDKTGRLYWKGTVRLIEVWRVIVLEMHGVVSSTVRLVEV
jgi:hypothetical protein